MPTLSSSIVNHHVASVSDVEEAVARQAMYGGDLATNLLELSAVSEADLGRVLAESHGLAAAATGQLPASGPEILRLVPRELALRFGMYPLESSGDTLAVAVSEPLPDEVQSDLGFSLGLRIEQRIAVRVRVQEALARDYDTPLELRASRILAKLAGRPDPNPSVVPASRAFSELSRDQTARPTPGEPIREPLDWGALTKKERKPRRIGPYTAPMAEADLLAAEGRDDVLRAFFDFASQYFDYAALFAVHGDLAEGRDAAGAGAARTRVVSLGIPLDLPSAMSRAVDSDRFSLTRLGTGGLDGALARDLDRRAGPLVLLLPVRLAKRTVLVLYGDHGDHDVELGSVAPVIAFTPLVSSALEHLILKHKQRGGGETRSLLPGVSRAPQRPQKAPLPGREDRAAALVSALVADDPPPSSGASPGVLARPVIAVGGQPRVTPAQGSPLVAAQEQELRPSPAKPNTPTPAVATVEPPEDGWDVGFQPQERATAPGIGAASRRLQLVSEPAPDAAPRGAPGTPSPEAPEISLGAASLDDDFDEAAGSGVPLAPASRALAHSARPLPIAHGSKELQLPTVMVDLANDCQALLAQLLAGDHLAGDKLVQIGAAAVTVLASSFPGPITAELRRGVGSAPSRASECGPVLRTLARIGTKAVSVLGVRTADHDPNVRAWATRLLGEMPSDEAAHAIVRRFIDDDQEVRRAALAAGRLMQGDPEARAMIQSGLAELLSDSNRPEEQRHALIEAIADLRDGRAVPTALRLLEDRSSELVRSAHWALVVLARQDHGLSAAVWTEWWRQNASRHRIEWLIDALLHDSVDIRRAAGDELKSTTKEYFGYYDDLPIAEREKAQARYRDWWETKGKARFR